MEKVIDQDLPVTWYVPLIYRNGRCIGSSALWAHCSGSGDREWEQCQIEPGYKIPWPSDPVEFAKKYAEVWSEEHEEALKNGSCEEP
jgi:hypothetical protein